MAVKRDGKSKPKPSSKPAKTRNRKKTKAKAAATAPAAPPVPPGLPEQAAGKQGDWRVMNRVQIAALMGVHEDTVTDFTRKGMPVTTRGGHGVESQYDAVECLAWWRDQQGRNAKELAQTRVFEVNAESGLLKLRKDRKELVSKPAIRLAGQAIVAGIRTKLLSLAVRMRHQGLIAREHEAAVRELCRGDLKDIEAWEAVADALRDTPPAAAEAES